MKILKLEKYVEPIKTPVVTPPQPIPLHTIHNTIVWMISKYGAQLVSECQRDLMKDFGQIYITMENSQ